MDCTMVKSVESTIMQFDYVWNLFQASMVFRKSIFHNLPTATFSPPSFLLPTLSLGRVHECCLVLGLNHQACITTSADFIALIKQAFQFR